MRLTVRQLRAMVVSDLRQRVRDKSVLIFALVVPLALMYVFNLVFGDADDLELRPVTVAFSMPQGDPLGQVMADTLDEVEVDELVVTLVDTAEDEVRDQVDDGDADLGVIVPDGFASAVREGRAVDVRAIEGDGAEVETQIVLSVVDGVLEQLTAGAVTAAAGGAVGLPPDELAALAEASVAEQPAYSLVEGEASSEQLDSAGALVAGQAGLFLLFTVGFGVLGLVAEREMGTLARLRSMPMRPGLVVAAKAMVSFVLGVVATSVLLVTGALLFGVDFGSAPAVAVLVLLVVAAASTLMFVVARVARTSEQAGIVQSIVALVLGIGGGAFFPINAAGVLGRLLDLNPVAAFTRGLGITAGGGGLTDLGGPVAIMLGFGVVMTLAARLLPDRGAAS